MDQRRILDRGRVDRDFVCALAQECTEVLDGADTTSDRKWDKDRFCDAAYHIDDRIPGIGGSGDIEEDELIGTCRVIGGCDLDRISGILQIDEVDALYDPSVFYIQTGNDSFRKHQNSSFRMDKKFFRMARPVLLLFSGWNWQPNTLPCSIDAWMCVPYSVVAVTIAGSSAFK